MKTKIIKGLFYIYGINMSKWLGAGTGKQTTPDTDGGQFKRAVDAYKANPKSIK